MLGYADYSLPFILETDASLEGPGAVLSQKQNGQRRVVAYASRSLCPQEKNMKNYSSQKLEMLALKWAMCEKVRGYLLGAHTIVYTDNNPLSHIQTTRLGAVEQWWAADLACFNFTLKYRSGRANRNADALSRNPVEQPEGPGEELSAVSCSTTVQPPRTRALVHRCTVGELGEMGRQQGAERKALRMEEPLEAGGFPSFTPAEIAQAQGEDLVIATILSAVKKTKEKPRRKLIAGMEPETKAFLKQFGRLRFKGEVLYREVDDPTLG